MQAGHGWISGSCLHIRKPMTQAGAFAAEGACGVASTARILVVIALLCPGRLPDHYTHTSPRHPLTKINKYFLGILGLT
jgi:hypothetical protein